MLKLLSIIKSTDDIFSRLRMCNHFNPKKKAQLYTGSYALRELCLRFVVSALAWHSLGREIESCPKI